MLSIRSVSATPVERIAVRRWPAPAPRPVKPAKEWNVSVVLADGRRLTTRVPTATLRKAFLEMFDA